MSIVREGAPPATGRERGLPPKAVCAVREAVLDGPEKIPSSVTANRWSAIAISFGNILFLL